MLLAILIICAIVFILALLYQLGCLVEKHMLARQKKYQDHTAALVNELFPPDIHTLQTPAVNTYTPNYSDPQYQESKRKMVADLRTCFNQRKINAAIAKIPGLDDLSLHQSVRMYP